MSNKHPRLASGRIPKDVVDQIVLWWNDNLSSGQIAMKLGWTRNMVIGLVTRQRKAGVELRRTKAAAPRPRLKLPMVEEKLPPPGPRLSGFERRSRLPVSEQPDEPRTDPNYGCLFIPGDDPLGPRCDKPRVYRPSPRSESLSPYCEFHYRLCYQPARSRI